MTSYRVPKDVPFSLSTCIEGFDEKEDEQFIESLELGLLCEDCGNPDDGYCRCVMCSEDMEIWGMSERKVLAVYRSEASEHRTGAFERRRRRKARWRWALFVVHATTVGKKASVVKHWHTLYLESLAPGGGSALRAAKRFHAAAASCAN